MSNCTTSRETVWPDGLTPNTGSNRTEVFGYKTVRIAVLCLSSSARLSGLGSSQSAILTFSSVNDSLQFDHFLRRCLWSKDYREGFCNLENNCDEGFSQRFNIFVLAFLSIN